MPWRETETAASHQLPRFRGLNHWGEVSLRVRVEAVKHPRNGFAVSVAPVPLSGDLFRPVRFPSTRPRRWLPASHQQLTELKNRDRSRPPVLRSPRCAASRTGHSCGSVSLTVAAASPIQTTGRGGLCSHGKASSTFETAVYSSWPFGGISQR